MLESGVDGTGNTGIVVQGCRARRSQSEESLRNEQPKRAIVPYLVRRAAASHAPLPKSRAVWECCPNPQVYSCEG